MKNLYCGPLLSLLISDELLSERHFNIRRVRDLLFGSQNGRQKAIISPIIANDNEESTEKAKNE